MIGCISLGQLIVALIILSVVVGLISRFSMPIASVVGGILPSLLFIWWLSGWFRDCNPAPQYQAPQYQAPQYQAPQYQAPQYQAPQYQRLY